MDCFTAATFDALTTGALATASSIFCSERAELVRVTVSPVCGVEAPAAEASPCDLSATTLLLFEPLMGAIGSAVEYALILSVTETLLGLHPPLSRLSSGIRRTLAIAPGSNRPELVIDCDAHH